jgi:hypothetical protein
MATKPGASFSWATDANFSSGPASGNPTKVASPTPAQGSIPGQAVLAEYYNQLFNITGQWVSDWLVNGSPAGAEDAHLVETDSFGATKVAFLQVGSGVTSADRIVQVFNAGAASPMLVSKVGLTTKPNIELTGLVGTHERGQLLIEAQNTPTGSVEEGEFWFEASGGGLVSRLCYYDDQSVDPLKVHATEVGNWSFHSEAIGPTVNSTSTLANKILTTQNVAPGKYIAHMTCGIKSSTGTTHISEVEFSVTGDVTGTKTQSFFYSNANYGAGGGMPFTVSWAFESTGAANVTFGIKYRTNTPGQGAEAFAAELTVEGAYDY